MAKTRERPSWGAIIGTIVFVAVVPGTVVGLVPYWFSGWRLGPPLLATPLTRWLGVVFIAVGLPLFADFVIRFVREGLGTPAPIAPTRHLVMGGPYRYTRNPGYVAVIAMLVGQALLFAQTQLLVYAVAVAAGFHLFVLLYEEPTLRQSYGAEYDVYCRQVPRWVPRLTARSRGGGDGAGRLSGRAG
jgi:protein-S-isoprenylcysteine O-methyltransferase Ste14